MLSDSVLRFFMDTMVALDAGKEFPNDVTISIKYDNSQHFYVFHDDMEEITEEEYMRAEMLEEDEEYDDEE